LKIDQLISGKKIHKKLAQTAEDVKDKYN